MTTWLSPQVAGDLIECGAENLEMVRGDILRYPFLERFDNLGQRFQHRVPLGCEPQQPDALVVRRCGAQQIALLFQL